MTVVDPTQLTSRHAGAARRPGPSAIAVDSVRGLLCLGGRRDTAVEFYDPTRCCPSTP